MCLYPCVGQKGGMGVRGGDILALCHRTFSQLLSISHILFILPEGRLLKVKSQKLILSLCYPRGNKHRMLSLPILGPRGLRKYGRKPLMFQNINCSEFPSVSICTILATITSFWEHGNILLTQGFSPSTLLTFWAGPFLIVGLSCTCEMLSSIPGLFPLDTSSTSPPPSCGNQKYFQILPDVPWGKRGKIGPS